MLRKTNNLFQKAHKTHRRRGMKSEENRRMWSSAVVQIDRVQMWGKFLLDGKFERFSTLSRLNVVAETCRNFTRGRGRNPPHLSRSSSDSGAMWEEIWFMLKNRLCECSTSLIQTCDDLRCWSHSWWCRCRWNISFCDQEKSVSISCHTHVLSKIALELKISYVHTFSTQQSSSFSHWSCHMCKLKIPRMSQQSAHHHRFDSISRNADWTRHRNA